MMRALVFDRRHDPRLAVIPGDHANPLRLAQARLAAVGGDRKARRDGAPVGQRGGGTLASMASDETLALSISVMRGWRDTASNRTRRMCRFSIRWPSGSPISSWSKCSENGDAGLPIAARR